MRVTFLTHNYPRFAGDPAGAFIATLAAALVRRGLSVRVIAPSDRGKAGEDQRDGVQIRRVRYAPARLETLAYTGSMQSALHSPGGFVALMGMWRALRRAARTELSAGADLIHAHWWFPAGLAIPAGAPYIVTSHGTDAALLRRSAVARRLAAPVYRRALAVTAVSTELARWIERGTGATVTHVQPMPVDSAPFRWSSGGAGAITVARLTAQKRIHLAIEAVALLAAQGRDLPLTIVGDGPERPALEQLAGRRGIERLVRFVGRAAPSEIPELLAQADLMLFPAQGEGFGLAAAEAFMAGVPVIACVDGGGVLDVVPALGPGRIAEPSGEAVAAAAIDLLSSRERESDLRAAGEHWRRTLAPDFVADLFERWYDEALGHVRHRHA